MNYVIYIYNRIVRIPKATLVWGIKRQHLLLSSPLWCSIYIYISMHIYIYIQIDINNLWDYIDIKIDDYSKT